MFVRTALSLSMILLTVAFIGLSTHGEATSPVAASPAVPPEVPQNRLNLPTRKEAMAMKLKETQHILEGIALNDFDKIGTAAKELIMVSNLVDFVKAYKGPEYAFHVAIMHRTAEAIAKKAEAKNMDGVMLAYNELTLSCLKCHQAIRDNRFEASPPGPTR